jgi:Amt family ammonium transporter
MVPHNLTITLLGAGLLWFGWFGFNAGSAVASDASAGLAFTVTQIASAAGCIGWLLGEKLHVGKSSALGAASGIVAGLVAITPASGFVEPMWAIVIGLLAGYICFRAVLLKDKFGYDDSLDAFGIHGVGGAWGALATGLFATVGGAGLFYGDAGQFGIQVLSIVVTAGYAFFITYILTMILDKTMGFRVDPETEISGLDYSQHGESGYIL